MHLSAALDDIGPSLMAEYDAVSGAGMFTELRRLATLMNEDVLLQQLLSNQSSSLLVDKAQFNDSAMAALLPILLDINDTFWGCKETPCNKVTSQVIDCSFIVVDSIVTSTHTYTHTPTLHTPTHTPTHTHTHTRTHARTVSCLATIEPSQSTDLPTLSSPGLFQPSLWDTASADERLGNRSQWSVSIRITRDGHGLIDRRVIVVFFLYERMLQRVA